jgi:hypothetical protein
VGLQVRQALHGLGQAGPLAPRTHSDRSITGTSPSQAP